MRETKFRARSIEDNSTWYYGLYYIEYGSMPHPIRTVKSRPPAIADTHWVVFPSFADWGMPREMQRVQIDPKTVGQYIGLKDKNGKEAYFDDVAKWRDSTFQIIWDDVYVCVMLKRLSGNDGMAEIPGWNIVDSEVIGNIYENPELLEEEK